jgi:hypothetical protein
MTMAGMASSEDAHMQRLIDMLQQDAQRLQILHCVAQLGLAECYVAAGFVRNMVWDHRHGYPPTPLQDVDVIYFDAAELEPASASRYQATLQRQLPEVNWQVKNQALMHQRNGDAPYRSCLDAMSYWPEKETAVAVRITADRHIEVISAFGLESLFALQLTHNPRRDVDTFHERVRAKQWLQQWPGLQLIAP